MDKRAKTLRQVDRLVESHVPEFIVRTLLFAPGDELNRLVAISLEDKRESEHTAVVTFRSLRFDAAAEEAATWGVTQLSAKLGTDWDLDFASA